MDLVDVGGIYGGCEGAEEERVGGEGGRDGVGVEPSLYQQYFSGTGDKKLRKNIGGLAIFRINKSFGLCITVRS